MAELKLYNTLTRKKEVFKPLKNKQAAVYSCGPTVYWYQHIGNLRTYIFNDLLKRVLLYNGYNVKHIINVTDVGHLTSDGDTGEDKMELATKKEHKTAQEIAQHYFSVFLSDLKKLNIISPDKWPRATAHIKEQISLIKKLEEKGFTYRTSDGIYFDTSKLRDYGKLAKLKVSGLKAGKRISLGEKRNKTDFALWKFSNPPGVRQQEWKSPWGVGFPGWHIECSAMSMKYLGEHFDIHTGGEDHIPIHHTNEIAQSEAATGKKFVNYWLHGAFLVDKEGKKISKSTGGLYTLSELENLGYSPNSFRYFCLQTNYRKPLAFSLENLDASKSAFEKTKRKIIELKKQKHKGSDETKKYENEFLEAINDDLNIPLALQIFLKALDDPNLDTKKKIETLKKFDSVLGLGIKDFKEEKTEIPQEAKELLKKRESLRKEKKFAEADIIRNKIKTLGYEIEDTPDGPLLRKI